MSGERPEENIEIETSTTESTDFTAAAEGFLERYDSRTAQEVQDFDANVESFERPIDALEHAEWGMAEDALEAAAALDKGTGNPAERFSRSKKIHALISAALLATGFAAPRDAHAGDTEGLVKAGVTAIFANKLGRALERYEARQDERVVEIDRASDIARIENDRHAQLQTLELRKTSLENQRARTVENLERAKKELHEAKSKLNPNDRNDQYQLRRLEGEVMTQDRYLDNIDRQLEQIPLQQDRINENAEAAKVYADQRANDRHIYDAADRAHRDVRGY